MYVYNSNYYRNNNRPSGTKNVRVHHANRYNTCLIQLYCRRLYIVLLLGTNRRNRLKRNNERIKKKKKLLPHG